MTAHRGRVRRDNPAMREAVQRCLDQAPPLTDEQTDCIQRLLFPELSQRGIARVEPSKSTPPPVRPRRSLPTAEKVARHWARTGGPLVLDLAWPACFRCGREAEEWHRLHRAHLVDRQVGGLDTEQNLAMLCRGCNRVMPLFDVGAEAAAIAWILDG